MQVYQIDNDAVKESNVRLGDNVTIVSEAPVESNYFATEHGRPGRRRSGPRRTRRLAWRIVRVASEQRFQRPHVLPGGRCDAVPPQPTAAASPGARAKAVTYRNVGQRKIRGMVNGNVLAPLAEERTPLATDPAMRAIVSRFLAAYPAGFPTAPISTRAPQHQRAAAHRRNRIATSDGTATRAPGARSRLLYDQPRSASMRSSSWPGRIRTPNINSHRARLAYRRSFSPATELAAGITFNRVKSLLLPSRTPSARACGSGYQFEELGPDSMFPIDRAQNSLSLRRRRQAPGCRRPARPDVRRRPHRASS